MSGTMSSQRKLECLGEVEIFDHVEDKTLREDVVAALDERRLGSGEVLFREGDPGGFIFMIAEGALEVRKRGEGDREILMRLMGPGEVGGLTSTTLNQPRSATLQARRESKVLTLSRERFLELLDTRPDVVRSVVAFLSGKVRGKTARLATLLARDISGTGEPVAVFDAKPYDRRFLDAQAGEDLSPHYFEARLSPETAGLAAGFRVVCAFVNDELRAETLERLAQGGVELIALRSAGFNNVDLEAAQRLGVTVVRVPEYSPYAVAEHTVGLILTLNRKIHRAYQRVREGNFSLAGLVGFDLHGRTAGVVGLGKIGRALAEVLLGFGMEVLAFDARPDLDYAARTGVRYVELKELLARSDVVSLNAPLTPETHHMIDASAISRMKPGAILINTGRGALVDTAALVEGLKSGQIGAAGLDVYEEEAGYFFEDRSDRVITDDVLARLLTFPNVVVTSHQAFLTADALTNIAETTTSNIRGYLGGQRGRELANVVLPPE